MTAQSHLGDLLSGLLDAELSPSEEAVAREHLASCRQCAIELEHISAARSWVRSLPPIEPPLGFIERLIREQEAPSFHLAGMRRGWASRWAGVAAFAASAAAAIAIVSVVSPQEPAVRPPVGQLVEAHATGASLSGDPLSRLAPAGVPISFKP